MKILAVLIGAFLLCGGRKVLIANQAPRRGFRETWDSLSREDVLRPIDRWEVEGKPRQNPTSCNTRQSYRWS